MLARVVDRHVKTSPRVSEQMLAVDLIDIVFSYEKCIECRFHRFLCLGAGYL